MIAAAQAQRRCWLHDDTKGAARWGVAARGSGWLRGGLQPHQGPAPADKNYWPYALLLHVAASADWVAHPCRGERGVRLVRQPLGRSLPTGFWPLSTRWLPFEVGDANAAGVEVATLCEVLKRPSAVRLSPRHL